jgi:Ca2+-binding RTX toxin-like protein
MGVGNSLDNVITGNSASNMLFGGDGDDRVEGKAGHDILNGGSGDDMLVGGFGADILIGGIGADTFRFNSVSEGLDTITDFSQSQNDAIAVSASGFGAGLTLGVLGSSQFTIGSAATTIDHRIIYDDSTGGLFFDADGTGAIGQVMFATLSTGLSLVSNDIVVAA